MAADPTTTTEGVAWQLIMKIQSTNYQVEGDVSLYPEELKMLVVALQHSVLDATMFNSFEVPMTWLSMASSTASYNKATDVITFNRVNEKRIRLTKKTFTQIVEIPNSTPLFQPSSAQILFMFNKMGHQPPLIKISYFKKFGLPCIWNFLVGIYLRCLTGRSVGLGNRRMEVYAMVAGLYYDLNVDFATHMWKEFVKTLENTNMVKGISCARY